MGKIAFVTVGTTLFESLIERVTDAFVLDELIRHGFTKLVIQYGKGTRPTLPAIGTSLLQLECYDFKPSLRADMQAADLILSHAGAGTLLEATSLLHSNHKPLEDGQQQQQQPQQQDLAPSPKKIIIVAVINTTLMDNHQTELAYALQNTGCLCVMDHTTDLLQLESWNKIINFQPTPFPMGDDNDLPRILNGFFGFGKNE